MGLDVRALIDEWLRQRQATGQIGASSAVSIRCRVGKLVELYGDMPPQALTKGALRFWQETTGGGSPTHRAHQVSSVRMFCRWLVEQGHLETDPSDALVKVRQRRAVPRALTAGQVATLLTCQDRRATAMVALMVFCGLRCKEVAGLDVSDWDLDGGVLFVRDGKGGHQRVVPLPPEACPHLATWMGERGWHPGPLIIGRSPRSPRDGRVTAGWVSTYISRHMAAAGVHVAGDGSSAHALRHTFASDVLDRCHDLRTVQALLGHTSLAATEVYLRRADLGRLREAIGGRDYSARASPPLLPGLCGTGSRGEHSPWTPGATGTEVPHVRAL